MARKKAAREFCSVDPIGKLSDADLHEPILNNDQADRAIADAAIRRAMKRGLSRGEAEALYGPARHDSAGGSGR